MKYCPECGTKLELRWIASDGRERRVCSKCEAIRYENPHILVAMMVSCGDKLLLCRRAQEPAMGTWTAPSGFMEQGETLEQAAARETFEEAGVRVPTDDLLLYMITNLPRISEVYVCFRANVADDRCRPGSESLDAA